MRIRLAGTAAVVSALVFGGLALASGTATKLNGQVGPGFTISLKNASGQKVTTLKPGSYTFAVQDKSGIHNFKLTGPVSKELTGIGFSGSKTTTLTLKAGKYTYLCTVHFFKGTFTVK